MTKQRIVILGGGFAGVATARRLERQLRTQPDIEIVLVSRSNFFILTPLLFEACSGTLELRHCAQPIRPVLRRSRFIEAVVTAVDADRNVVHLTAGGVESELTYEILVVALGSSTNLELIPGSESAFTFKTMADALVLRNHFIEQLERADSTAHAALRARALTFVVIGGGLVGIELLGELTALADDVLRYYPRIRRDELRFHLFEATARILPEVDQRLASVATRVLAKRGAEIRASTPVRRIEPDRLHIDGDIIEASTIVLAAGIVPSAAVNRVSVARNVKGQIAVDSTMRSVSHSNVWALGDCATIPAPDGKPYPALAQHAIREAKQLARNIAAVVQHRAPEPFVFRSLGTMAALGHSRAVAQVMGVRITGFVAWWFRRTYYLLQMPRWDRRLRIILDWTISLFFRHDITKVDLAVEHDQMLHDGSMPHEAQSSETSAKRLEESIA